MRGRIRAAGRVTGGTLSLGARLTERAASGQSALDEISVSLLLSTLKTVVVLLGVFATADVLPVPYRTVFAGLGIGGLAFAIAAQDTIANSFGSAVLLADRPFRRGDHIIAGDLEGFVEHLGLRSTRLRTFDDSIVIVPNRELAKSAIDNRSARRERRFEFVLSVEYDTSGPRLVALTEALRTSLAEFAPDEVRVGVDALGDSAIEIRVTLGVEAETYSDEVAARQTVLLHALNLCEEHNVGIAFPTRTLHVANLSSVDAMTSSLPSEEE
ncbi:MAG: mechanosensitive ion channel family protein [Polyangiales bacterium]